MAAVQFIVEGGHTLSALYSSIRQQNAALPVIAAALLTDQPVTLSNIPRIRDVETLVDLVRSVGASATWDSHDPNTLHIHAKDVHAASLDPGLCARIRASILLAAPLLARCGEVALPPPGGDVIGRRRVDTHFLAFEQMGPATTSASASCCVLSGCTALTSSSMSRASPAPKTRCAPPRLPMARRSCATPPASRTCRIWCASCKCSACRSKGWAATC